MVAIPTVLYIGDEQISGGPNGGNRAGLGTGGFSTLWGIYRHNKKLNKPVPSQANGINVPVGVTEGPYWDGTFGNWVQFFPVPGTQANGLLPLAYGDNWYEAGSPGNTGAVTPCALLMHSLWERFGNQIAPNPGFKVIKQAFAAGFGGAGGFKQGGGAYAGTLATVTNAATALAGGNTLDVRAIIIDCSTTDLFNNNLTYIVDAASFIDNIRASLDALASVTCVATTPIILVNHHQDMLATTAQATRLLRRFTTQIADAKENVYVFDMNWAVDWQQLGVLQSPILPINQPAEELVNKRYYAPETYLQAGLRLGNFLNRIWAAAPPLSQGSAIPVVVMIGDSQFVGTIDPVLVLLTEQESLLGPDGGTVRDYQYVWDAQNEVIEAYDVMANSNTFGTVSQSLFGPDATFLKNMGKEFPNGVILFKYARNGVSLTLEANGAANAVEKDAATIWDDIAEQWMKFKTACLQSLGLSPDCVGIVTDLGSNDEGTASAYNAFATKAGEFVDDIRELFGTRATGGALPVVWLQPPPHIAAGGNSGHNTAAGANSVRATIAALPSQKDNLAVVLNTGADKYELRRDEAQPVHYGGEANLQIGYDLADTLVPLIGSAAGSPGAGAGGGVDDGIDAPPSEAASFVVETGTGSATANSYCSEAFATTYHETYGNPDAWLSASTFDHQDALRQATRALDIRYGSWWSGVRYGSTQALDWPRAYVYDAAGNPVPATTIPTRLQQATAILALLHVQGENILPSTSTTADIRSETLSSASGASKSVTYIGGKRAETQFPIIDRMLSSAGLTSGGAGWGWLDL